MLDNQFFLEKCIGQGGSSRVYLANHLETGEKFAVKMLRKDKGYEAEKGARIMQKEHERLTVLQGHPNILQSYFTTSEGNLYANDKNNDVMYNVIELAENGSFSPLIRATGGLGEELVKFQFLQICHAISHMHQNGYAHMDVKLENILLDNRFNAKVADMGVSLDVSQSNGLCESRRGTVCYMAPEVNHLLPGEQFDAYKSDVYSLGICLYVLIFGEFPVKESDESSTMFDSETMGCLTGLKCSFGAKQWNCISSECQDLLSSMLTMEPEERPTMDELLQNEWFNSAFNEDMSLVIYEEMEQRKLHMLRENKLKALRANQNNL